MSIDDTPSGTASATMHETTTWLTTHDYHVTSVDASSWSSERDLHRDIAAALDFPDYYGHNLDALNDCMRDVVSQDYGWAPNTTGLAQPRPCSILWLANPVAPLSSVAA